MRIEVAYAEHLMQEIVKGSDEDALGDALAIVNKYRYAREVDDAEK